MEITIEDLTEAPERAEFDPMLREYFGYMSDQFVAMGSPRPDIELVIEEYWTEAADYLPPGGRTLLARDGGGALVGMGSLRAIGGGKGELKRLYVRAAARGTGLGRRLVEARIAAAREMGLTTLLADSFAENRPMLALYEGLGFRRIDAFPESATYRTLPQLRPFLAYVRLDLGA